MNTYTTPLKASSVAFDARGIWYGVVQEVNSHRLKVLVPRLSGDIIYGPLDVIGMNTDTYAVGDPVMLGFIEGRQDELVVMGRVRTASTAPITNLDDLADVQVPAPSSGQFLQWDGERWISASVTSVGSSALDDLADVEAPSPSSGQYLKWNGIKWMPSSTSLDDLSDVQSTSPSTGQYLRWNGTQWEPATMTDTRTSTSTTDAATANSVRQAHRDAMIAFHMEVM